MKNRGFLPKFLGFPQVYGVFPAAFRSMTCVEAGIACRRNGKIISSTKREEFRRRRTEKFYQLVLMSRRNEPETMNDIKSSNLMCFLCLIRHTGSKSIDMFSCKDNGGNRLSNSTRNQQKQKL